MSTANKPDRAFLKRLRDQTHAAHEATEAAVDIMAASATHAGYAQILGKLYGLHKPFEAFFAHSVLREHPELDLAKRQKSDWLAQDMQRFSLPLEHVALCKELPDVSTLPACLGVFYVLEGSSLGGQIIARHLQATLGLDAASGARFFNGYGDETGALWRHFGDVMCALLPSSEQQDTAIVAANDTFGIFRRWMTGTAT